MAERVSMIHVRNGFSEAHGMGSCNTQMQIDDLDDRTRNILFNYLSDSLNNQFKKAREYGRNDLWRKEDFLCRGIITLALAEKTNPTRHYEASDVIEITEKILENALYNEVFDFLEFLGKLRYNDTEQKSRNGYYESVNMLLEHEYVGYRFVNGKIAPITDKNEIDSIENACSNEFEGIRAHIKKAVGFVADREHKDYQNCIKESISAVESICSIVAEQKKSLLGDALKNLKKKGVKIHPQLESAFLKLYDYTNSEKGIRHANGMFESDVSFEEAKFMLVSCSAFVNYLTANYGKVGGKHA